jgi:hypothetical protein
MGNYYVAWLEGRRELPAYFQKRVVIGDKNFDQIAHLRDLCRRADEIWHGLRSSVPHEHAKTLFPQNIRDPASDDSEADYADISLYSTSHRQKVQANRLPGNG